MVNKKMLTRVASFVLCAIVFCCSLVPSVNAFVIDSSANTKEVTLLTGTLALTIEPVSDDVSSTIVMTDNIGGQLPWISSTGTNYLGESDMDYLLRTNTRPDWSISSAWALARYKRNIAVKSGATIGFDLMRYNVTVNDTELGSSAHITKAVYTFEPYYFNNFDSAVFTQMFNLRLTRPTDVTVSINWSRFDKSQNRVVSLATLVSKAPVGNSNIEVFKPLEWAWEQHMKYFITNGDVVMLNSIVVTVQRRGSEYMNGVSMELLAEQWSSSSPSYIPSVPVRQWTDYVNNNIERETIVTAPTNTWTEWLASVARGIFDAEIMPGFTFGGIFGIMIAVVCITLILKFFGGG